MTPTQTQKIFNGSKRTATNDRIAAWRHGIEEVSVGLNGLLINAHQSPQAKPGNRMSKKRSLAGNALDQHHARGRKDNGPDQAGHAIARAHVEQAGVATAQQPPLQARPRRQCIDEVSGNGLLRPNGGEAVDVVPTGHRTQQ